MKKTVNANIAGSVFHIEEDAYEQLQRYLGGIRANFSGSAGADEIMADIEARIAELFSERLQGRSVVTLMDVQHVESVMGRPEDFAGEEGEKQSATPPPPPQATYTGRKRLFRDPEDKWIGGVLSGLANYVVIDPLWLRVAFIAMVWFGYGTPVLVYLLMWILVPKAGTAAEKLEMRGEPVTVDNIKRVFEEGAERVKAGGERMANEAREMGRQWEPKARSAASNAGTVISKLLGVFMLIIAFGLLLSLITGLIGGTFSLWHVASWNTDNMGILDLGGLLFMSKAHALWMAIGIFVLLVVPVIGLFLAGFRLLIGSRTPAWLGWTLSILWFSALVPVIAMGLELAHDFQKGNTIRTEMPLQQPADQLLYLDALPMGDSTGKWSVNFDDGEFEVDMDGVQLENGFVHGGWAQLDITQSADSLYHLLLMREARASNAKTALDRAKNIRTSISQEGDVLFVSPVISYPTDDKLRAQDAKFLLQVPLGKSVFLRPDSKQVIYDIDNVTNTHDRDMIGRTWTMTEKGLRDLKSDPLPVVPVQKDTVKAGPVAASVWHGPSARRNRRIERRPVATVVTEPSGAGVQLPSVLGLLSAVVRL